MRNSNILFIYAKPDEQAIGRELCPNGQLFFVQLGQELDVQGIGFAPSIVIIYDSTRNGQGKTQLEKIRQLFPEMPILLIVKDPSKLYLRAALDCKVSDFFALPIESANVRKAIRIRLQQRIHPGMTGRLLAWLSGILQLVRTSLWRRATDMRPPGKMIASQDALPITPPIFQRFLGKDPELKNTYDLSIQFLGKLTIDIRGKTVPRIRGKKNLSVLAYLLFHHHRSVHRDVLIDKFWSDVNAACAKNSLNVAICSIRKDLAKVLPDQELILYENESYCINPQLEIITDVDKFAYMWKKGQSIEADQGLSSALHAYNKAVGLYQKEFLEELRFEDWCESERANLREIYLFILNRLSAYFLEQENYYACINVCKKMLSIDQCLEAAYRKLMECYHALGLMDMAIKQFLKCKKVLSEELDLQPSLPTVDLFEKIQRGAVV